MAISRSCFASLVLVLGLHTLGAQENSRWSLEATVQAHSVAGPSSPWVGLGPLFRVFDAAQLGLRGFVPIVKPFDQSTYSLQCFIRARVLHGEKTDLFVEPEYAENFYTVLPFSSFGLAIGAVNRIRQDLSVGVSGGVEMAKVVVDSIGLERRSTWIIYPKISLLANFNF
jgi:hypothetical protein